MSTEWRMNCSQLSRSEEGRHMEKSINGDECNGEILRPTDATEERNYVRNRTVVLGFPTLQHFSQLGCLHHIHI
jgi:hypothetical protein